MKKLFNVKVMNILGWILLIGSWLSAAYSMITMAIVTKELK